MSIFLPTASFTALRAQDTPAGVSDDFAPVDFASLLDTPSLPEDDLQEDPQNPFGLAPASALPEPILTEGSVEPAETPAAAAQREREAYLASFAVNNALTRTAFQNSRSTGARFFDGFGGIPNPTNSPLVPKIRPGEYRLHLGPLKVTPSLGASYSQSFGSSNIQSSAFGSTGNLGGGSGRASSSDSDGGNGNINFGLSAEIGEPALGRFLTLDYGVSLRFGSGGGTDDSQPDQTLTLLGTWDFVRLKFGLGISFDSLSGTDREFGRDIQRDLATISFTTSYIHSPKTSIDLDLSMPISQYDGGIDSTEFSVGATANYHYSTKTTFGLNFTTGYTSLSGSSSVSGPARSDSQTYERVGLRMSSTASPFISYFGSVGCEWRDAGDTQSTSPVFNLGVSYRPRVGTSFTLSVDQQIETSAAIAASNFTTTSVTLSASQRLGSFVNLGASLGYEYASYQSTSSEETVDRRDRTFFAQLSISRTFFDRISLSGGVSYYDTRSNDLPQQSTQIFVSASYAF